MSEQAKIPVLSQGHQDVFDAAQSNEQKRSALQEEIKNDEFGIRLLNEAIQKPKYSEEQKQDKRNQISELENHIIQLKNEINGLS